MDEYLMEAVIRYEKQHLSAWLPEFLKRLGLTHHVDGVYFVDDGTGFVEKIG